MRGRGDHVEACARDPEGARELRALAGERVRLHRVDVTDATTVRSIADALGSVAVDVVFNVAGTYGGPRQSLAQLAEDLALEDVLRAYDVNARGALRLVLALLPHVRRGTAKRLVHITSGMGSISDNNSGGYLGYRMSKAALNMMSRTLAVDLRGEGITSVVVNPGWVQTDMGGPSAPTPVAESVRGILREVDRVTLADSGEFLNWDGSRSPW
ncbi:SDR family oxidoreductase [Nannocystis pusilla]|uniref:SDR family oxidoreductase n=1 Tax=Nannocystis pusilla TaxID=889268 RepID=UPI003BF39FFA